MCGESRGLAMARQCKTSSRECNGLTKPSPSKTASTIPAVNAEQLGELISRGTDVLRVRGGSLSMIMSRMAAHVKRKVEGYIRDTHIRRHVQHSSLMHQLASRMPSSKAVNKSIIALVIVVSRVSELSSQP